MSEVNIVIPAYNSQQFIGRAIESVLEQTFRDLKLIVVDDGSSDGTLDVASHYAKQDKRISVHHQGNRGVAAARNTGISLLEPAASYVLFLDNDDYLEPDALEMLRSRLLALPPAVATYGLAREVGRDGTPITLTIQMAAGLNRLEISSRGDVVAVKESEPTTFSSLLYLCAAITTGQVLIRHSCLKRVGPFDPQMVPCDDWDMYLRLSLYGPFVRLTKFTINWRRHESNVSGNGKAMADGEAKVRKKFATADFLDKDHRDLARRGYLLSCRLRLQWARERLKRHQFLEASKDAYRGVRGYIRFLLLP